MQRSHVHIRNVHGNLGDTVFLYEPADCLAPFESSRDPYGLACLVLDDFSGQASSFTCRTALLPHVESHRHRTTRGSGVEVEIHGNQEIPGADIAGTGLRNSLRICLRPEIRLSFRVNDFFRQGFIFSRTTYCKVLSFRLVGRSLITVARDAEFIVDALGKSSGKLSAFFESDAGNRYERKHISSS